MVPGGAAGVTRKNWKEKCSEKVRPQGKEQEGGKSIPVGEI